MHMRNDSKWQMKSRTKHSLIMERRWSRSSTGDDLAVIQKLNRLVAEQSESTRLQLSPQKNLAIANRQSPRLWSPAVLSARWVPTACTSFWAYRPAEAAAVWHCNPEGCGSADPPRSRSAGKSCRPHHLSNPPAPDHQQSPTPPSPLYISAAVLAQAWGFWQGTNSNEGDGPTKINQNTTPARELQSPNHYENDGMKPEITSILLLIGALSCWLILKRDPSNRDKQTQEDIWHLSQGWKKWWRSWRAGDLCGLRIY